MLAQLAHLPMLPREIREYLRSPILTGNFETLPEAGLRGFLEELQRQIGWVLDDESAD